MKTFIFENIDFQFLNQQKEQLKNIFNETGILYFPKLAAKDNLFNQYIDDLKKLVCQLIEKNKQPAKFNLSLDELITELGKIDVTIPRFIADLGTQSNKLISANQFKYRKELVDFMSYLFDEEPILATPAASDTLHIFLPYNSFHKYNLPIHQDYPYLMQSTHQITAYLNLGEAHQDIGGVTFWPGSHTMGVMPCQRNENNHFECIIKADELAKFNPINVFPNFGDVTIFHSLLWHKSIRNKSQNHSRLVQLFRYSDINNQESLDYYWQSTTYPRQSNIFENYHQDLYYDDEKKQVK